MEHAQFHSKARIGWRGIGAIVLIAIFAASALFYIYDVAPGPVKTPPAKTLSLRYDEVLLDDFEGAGLYPPVWNVTGFWGSSSGPQGYSPFPGCYQGENCASPGRLHNTDSRMSLNLSLTRVWINYTSLLLNFSLWVDTNPNDVLYVDYYSNGNWNVASQYSGHMSTTEPLNQTSLRGWFLPQLTLPTTTTIVRFRYSTGCCEPLYQGVFVDDLGVYMVGPASYGKLEVDGLLGPGSSPLSIPVSVDGGRYITTFDGPGFAVGATFLCSPGNHTLTVPRSFSNGSNSYNFTGWSDGFASTTRTVSIPPVFGYLAEFNRAA